MQASYYDHTGPAKDVLRVGEVPDPVPGAGEVRVRLRWSGVNPSDAKQRAGRGGPPGPVPRTVPHSDGMGAIDRVGAGVEAARMGQRVWTWNAAYQRTDGTAAEFVVLPDAQAVALPDEVADDAGACLGIPALTALHALLTDGGVAGRRVLVAGGAGAVGEYAIQFARLLGAIDVVATVSSDQKAAIAREAGATLCIDYRREDVAERVRDATDGVGVDRAIEVDIARNAPLDLEAVAEGGIWVVYGSSEREFGLPFLPLINRAVLMRFFSVYRITAPDRKRAIATLTAWLRRRQIRHRIAARFPLSESAAAHEMVEGGTAIGNVVVAIP